MINSCVFHPGDVFSLFPFFSSDSLIELLILPEKIPVIETFSDVTLTPTEHRN